jgi:hypothetical protein
MTSMSKQNGRHRLEKQNICERAKTKRILSATAVALAAGGGLQMVNATASFAAPTPNTYNVDPGSDGYVNIQFNPNVSEEEMRAVESAALNANGAILNPDGSLKLNTDGTPTKRPNAHEIVQFASEGEDGQVNVKGVNDLRNEYGQKLHGRMHSDGTLELDNSTFPADQELIQQITDVPRWDPRDDHRVTPEEFVNKSHDGQTRIATHELGHGLGLNHPFAATDDEIMIGGDTASIVDRNGNPGHHKATTFSDAELAYINQKYPQQAPQPQGSGSDQAPQPQGSGSDQAPQPQGSGSDQAPQPQGSGSDQAPQPQDGGIPAGSSTANSNSDSPQQNPTFLNGQVDSAGNYIADDGQAWNRNGNTWTNVRTGQTLQGDGVNWDTQSNQPQTGGQDPSQTGWNQDPSQTGGQDPSQTGWNQDPSQTGGQDPSQTGWNQDPSQTGGQDPSQTGWNVGGVAPDGDDSSLPMSYSLDGNGQFTVPTG